MSRDVKVISIYSLKSVFNVFLGETRQLGAPELSRRPPAAINSRIYIIVSGKKLSICKRGSKTQAKACDH